MLTRNISGMWECCNADIQGPYPLSTRGNKYLVIFQCAYSKNIEIAAISKANAVTVARKFVELVYCRHGAPLYLNTDNGTPFIAKVLLNVSKLLGVKQTQIIPYRPQSNASERSLKDVGRAIASFCGEKQDEWDRVIPQLSLAINTSYQGITGYAPFELLYGRKIRLPAITDAHLHCNEQVSHEMYAKELQQSLTDAHTRVRENLKASQAKQKQHYDARRIHVDYSIGDIVWKDTHPLSNAAAGICAKLCPKRDGPWKITAKPSTYVYKLTNLLTLAEAKAHADQLQTYFSESKNAWGLELPNTSASPISNNSIERTNPLPDSVPSDTADSDTDSLADVSCQLPNCFSPDDTDYIYCDLCDRTFHCACVDTTLEAAKELDFICPICRSEAS